MGSWSRINIVDFAMEYMLFIILLVWKTRIMFRQRKMRTRMTKRIKVVIAERWENRWYSVGPFCRYGYLFSGLDEYKGVTFDGRWPYRVRKRYEEGEIVSLLVNEHNLEEFWFEGADKPGIGIIVLWIIVVLGIFICIPYIPIIIRDWDKIR